MEQSSSCEENSTNSRVNSNGAKRNTEKRLSKKNSDVSCKSKRSVKRKLKTFSFGRWQRRLNKDKVKKNFSLSRDTCQSSISIVSETSVESVTCICTGYRRTKIMTTDRSLAVKEEVDAVQRPSPDNVEGESSFDIAGPSTAAATSSREIDSDNRIQTDEESDSDVPLEYLPPVNVYNEINMQDLTIALSNDLGFSNITISHNHLLGRYSEISLPYNFPLFGSQIYSTSVHTQVDYVHHLVPALQEITNCGFYWGKMDRYKAEKQLEKKSEGTFLLRDSAQEEFLFSVSFRRYGRTLHARVEQMNHKFSFDSHDPSVFSSSTVCGLIEHYKNPRCCMFFEPMLTIPVHRKFPFSLTHLCRSVISDHISYDNINRLKLPKCIKAFLKEYHYKQKVQVRSLEHDV